MPRQSDSAPKEKPKPLGKEERRELDRLLRAYHPALKEMFRSSAPCPETRLMLEDRLAFLVERLSPASEGFRAELRRLVLPVLDHYRPREGDHEKDRRLDSYVEPLSRYPLWAVRDAARNFLGGLVYGQNSDFERKAPALCREADRLLEPFMREQRDIRCILDAKIIADPGPKSDEAKARVRAELAAMKRDFARKSVDPVDASDRGAISRADAGDGTCAAAQVALARTDYPATPCEPSAQLSA